jgi:hypothetical protein
MLINALEMNKTLDTETLRAVRGGVGGSNTIGFGSTTDRTDGYSRQRFQIEDAEEDDGLYDVQISRSLNSHRDQQLGGQMDLIVELSQKAAIN